jgi:uncharacterized protein
VPIFLALFGAGVGAGLLGAVMGLGGGIFLVPTLSLLFHLPMRVAVGASLVGVVATSAAVAAVESPKHGADVALALRLEMATTAGAITGGWLAGRVSSPALQIFFAIMVFLTAAYTLYQGHGRSSPTESLFNRDFVPRRWFFGVLLAFMAGIVSGLLGVGGGFIKVPMMYAVMGVPMGIATATSNFMVGITGAASFFVYYGRGDIYPFVAIPTCIGVMLGAMLGGTILPYLRVRWIRLALVAAMLIMGSQMLMQGLEHF